jgi:E3 ubiquitin-protein ligase synoviolin
MMQYLILVAKALSTIIKYFFNLIDMQYQDRWENKGAYVLYLEFFADLYGLIAYCAFFATILRYYGVPLHLIRQLYHAFTSFKKRIVEVVKYRAATQNMNAR